MLPLKVSCPEFYLRYDIEAQENRHYFEINLSLLDKRPWFKPQVRDLQTTKSKKKTKKLYIFD